MAADPKSSSPAGSPRGRVLIVEDNLVGLQALARILRRRGYEVLEATDGASALAITATQPRLDVLLVDLALPDYDGRELCSLLKSRVSPTPIVALLTGWLEDSEHGDLRRWGIDVLFFKPLDIDNLLEGLQVALEDRSRREPDPPTSGD